MHGRQRIPTSPSLFYENLLYIAYLRTPTRPPLFLLAFFFDYMGDRATSDVLFYLMRLWIYTCQALVPWYLKDLVVCFMQQSFNLLKSSTWGSVLLVLSFDILLTRTD